jgi:hypothetical protein
VEHRVDGDPDTLAAVRAALERMHAAASR